MASPDIGLDLSKYKLGWSDAEDYVFKPKKGLSEEIVREMSWMKGEPEWMLKERLKALGHFESRPLPSWGGDLSEVYFDDIYYYIKPTESQVDEWDELPDAIKETYEKLGIPEAERKYLAGVTAQYESEVVFHRNRDDLQRQGVIFCDMDTALREHPDIVKAYFGKIIPKNDNKFAALNTSVWSGGSFIYVPPVVSVDMPLQAYFRINAENMGQFERTLIIADEGSQVHYIEGCSAPVYSTDSLHSAVVEIVVKPSARVTYTTIQNWSNNVFNLVTKRARVEAEGHMEWIDGNIGCIAQGSTVTTPSGTKPIELVTPGDRVLSFDEAAGELCFKTVTAKRFAGYQRVRQVKVGACSLMATDNHPFYSRVDPGPGHPEGLGCRAGYVRADHLEEAILPAGSLDYGCPHKLDRADVHTHIGTPGQTREGLCGTSGVTSRLAALDETTDDLMWLLGLFVGGGSIERAPSSRRDTSWAQVTFSAPSVDRARDRLVGVVGRLLPEDAPAWGRDGVTLHLSSVELADLMELNGFESGVQRKRFPTWVLDLPESQRLELLAGYLDSEGCAARRCRGFTIDSVNRPLLDDVSRLLTTLGIRSCLLTDPPGDQLARVSGGNPIPTRSYRLDFHADPRIVSRVSPRLREAVMSQAPGRAALSGRAGDSGIDLPGTVEIHEADLGPSGPVAPCWDIEVEGTGNFVCDGFIVHNSRLTMKYPAVYMVGPKASGEVLSVAYAGPGQHQDAGAKMVHAAPETTSKIVSKSISKDGGRTSYRGLVHVDDDAYGCKSHVQCDALILDEESISDTFPYMEVGARDANVGHEATVSRVADEQMFYLMSRGLTEEQAMGMIVNGFIEPVTRTLPMEYAVEWSRLIELQMEGSVG